MLTSVECQEEPMRRISDATISAVMAEFGRRGSPQDKSRAGKQAAKSMTPEQRTARARKAGLASAAARRSTGVNRRIV